MPYTQNLAEDFVLQLNIIIIFHTLPKEAFVGGMRFPLNNDTFPIKS